MAKPRRGDTLELAIEDLAFGGEGVGRADGYVVFVRGGLPGDRLRVRVVEARGRFGRAVIDEVLVASPDRVDPPRSEEHTSESSHTVISYAVFCLKKKIKNQKRQCSRR